MPRKARYKIEKDMAVEARKTAVKALQSASESLPEVVAMYSQWMISDDRFLRIQSAQCLERLAARYEALDIGANNNITVVFRGGVPQLGEVTEDVEVSVDNV